MRTYRIVKFAVPADHRVKIKENKKRDEWIDLAREQTKQNKNKKNPIKYEAVGDTNCNWCARNNLQSIGKGTGRRRNQRTRGDHPDYSIKIGQNTEKSSGDLRRLVIAQTPVKNHQLTLVGKTRKEVK